MAKKNWRVGLSVFPRKGPYLACIRVLGAEIVYFGLNFKKSIF